MDRQGRSDEQLEQRLFHSFHPDLREDLGQNLARIVCLNDINAVRQLHINPIDSFNKVRALDLLSGSRDILADVFSEIGLDPEASPVSVEAVMEKAVQGLGAFTCTVEVVLVADETKQTMTLQLAVDAKDKRYELRNARVL